MGRQLGLLIVLLISLSTVQAMGPDEMEPGDAARGGGPWDNGHDYMDKHGHKFCSRCAPNSNCMNRTCSCMPGFIGDPEFYCHNSSNHYCSLMNDPSLLTFIGERRVLDLLGSTKFAEVNTKNLEEEDGGTCHLTLWAQPQRVKGKVFINGLQFELICAVDDDEIVIEHRIFASVVNGAHIWNIEAKKKGVFKPYVKFSSITPLVLKKLVNPLSCTVDYFRYDSKILLVSSAPCGIKFGIRAFDDHEKSTHPGIFIEVEEANEPWFNNWTNGTEPLCLDNGTRTISTITNRSPIRSPRLALTYHATTNGGLVDFPGSPTATSALIVALKSCSNAGLANLFQNFGFAVTSAKFINCMSMSSGLEDIVDFLMLQLRWFCRSDGVACRLAQNLISGNMNCTHVVRHEPQVKSFVNIVC
ncbi:uncharacterized protein LOC131954906 [Physella acuta]|uniref:uncharacterized protein LOC131954906 n=1 Tax=Physella acuta TaxID=109671 RepID=UPI0027DDEC69|nr:uncharacterized protein LOC131954906 [Physella acuta]